VRPSGNENLQAAEMGFWLRVHGATLLKERAGMMKSMKERMKYFNPLLTLIIVKIEFHKLSCQEVISYKTKTKTKSYFQS